MTAAGVAIRERPIIFNGEMVRAILAGRKTQTRRVVNRLRKFGKVTEFGSSDTPGYQWTFRDRRMLWNDLRHDDLIALSPYGVPGDRLWVRETHWLAPNEAFAEGLGARVIYRVDVDETVLGGKWRSPIFMPRWASRLTLEVVGVRVERVQEISLGDCDAEGIDLEGEHADDFHAAEKANTAGLSCGCRYPEIYPFACLWDHINAKRGFGWDVNPWVWVVEFRVLTAAGVEV